MEFNRIIDVVESFEDAKLAIDFNKGTNEDIKDLGDILENMTDARPFDGKSYADYMTFYRDSYPLLACESHRSVSSYVSSATDCRKYILTIQQVLDIVHNEHAKFSEEDFDEVF